MSVELDRIEDIENILNSILVPIAQLTESDDLEAVKAKVNEIIKELNKVFLSRD